MTPEPPVPVTPASIPEDLPFAVSLKRVNLTVGYIAVLLPVALWAVARWTGTCATGGGLDSLSHFYFSRLGGEIFVGALSVIGALLLFMYTSRAPAGAAGRPVRVNGYMNHSATDLRLAKIAGAAAFVIALVPTIGPGCAETGEVMRAFATTPEGFHDPARDLAATVETPLRFDLRAALGIEGGVPFLLLGVLHEIAAAVMFLILGHFSWSVFTRVQSPDALRDGSAAVRAVAAAPRPPGRAMTGKKRLRNALYRVSGAVIFATIAALALKSLLPEAGRAAWHARNLTFWCEAAALWAFGTSWLVKGRFIGWLDDRPARDRQVRADPVV